MTASPPTSHGTVQTDISNGVATIRFSHPKANALPLPLLRSLATAIDTAGHDPAARVLVISSAGDKAFCAGASFDELQGIANLEQSCKFFSGFAAVLLSMRNCPLLIIARVQGKAVGGGVGVLAAADYAIAVESAAVRLSEFAYDFGPFTIAPALERKIGPAHLAALAMDTEWRDSTWCKMTGLFSRTVPSLEDLDTNVGQLAATLAGRSLDASRELKQMLWSETGPWTELLAKRAQISGRLWLAKANRGGA